MSKKFKVYLYDINSCNSFHLLELEASNEDLIIQSQLDEAFAKLDYKFSGVKENLVQVEEKLEKLSERDQGQTLKVHFISYFLLH